METATKEKQTIDTDGLSAEFEKLLDQNSEKVKYKSGQIIKGVVLYLEKDGALVDISSKSEAFLPTREIINKDDTKLASEVIEAGKEYEFYVLKEENDDSPLLISYKRVALARGWVKLEELKEKNDVIEGDVVSVVKGGLVVEISGVRGFIPASQLRVKNDSTPKGTKIPVKIIEMDKRRNKLILSQRLAIVDERAEQREETLSNLEIGQVVSGEVVRVAEFGAFVDIGGVDGLLPISELSWQRVQHPKEVLNVNDNISVKVLKIDKASGRISLSLKRLQPDPWTEIEEKFAEGQIIKGTVSKLAVFGAFVEIYPGVEALLPVQEITNEEEDPAPDKYLKVGDEIEVLIKRFSPYERRISLSLKDVQSPTE